jgi:hypothetical protein
MSGEIAPQTVIEQEPGMVVVSNSVFLGETVLV